MFDKYIVFTGVHPITTEYEEMKKQGYAGMFDVYKEGTHTLYEFPNGVEASLIHFPHQTGMFSWTYEVMADGEIYRPKTIEDVNKLLVILMNT